MKKIAAIAVLTLTGLSAFAAPLSRPTVTASNFHKTAVVAHKNNNRKAHRRAVKKAQVRKAMFRQHRTR